MKKASRVTVTQSGWVICFAILATFVPLAHGQNAVPTRTTLQVEGARPVQEAVLHIIRMCNCVITYEDPLYRYSGDLEPPADADPVSAAAAGAHPKWFELKGGSLRIAVPKTNRLPVRDVESILETLAQDQTDADDGGGQFRVTIDGDIFHIVPVEVRDSNGNWEIDRSILSVPITLSKKARTKDQMFEAICSALSAVTHVTMVAMVDGGIVVGAPDSQHYVLNANHEPAVRVLMRALSLMKARRTWFLDYDPVHSFYVLNILRVSDIVKGREKF